jgi:hypothetical protein
MKQSVKTSGKKAKRGRPRKVLPPPRRLSHKLTEFGARVGRSRMTVWRWIKNGRVRVVLPPAGGPPEIPVTEYIRLGYLQTLDHLDQFENRAAALPPAAAAGTSATP